MIPRYTLPEMGALWSEETKFQKWLDVEIAVCEVHAEMGTIPREALEQIKSRAKFSVQRINEIEKTTDHDVIAFTDRKSTRLNSSHLVISYAVFCLKKKTEPSRATYTSWIPTSASRELTRC